MSTNTASNSITIHVPASRVWTALTDPAEIKQYLFGTNVKSDWKVGSAITYSGDYNGQSYEDKGTILKMAPNQLLQSTYWSGFSGLEDKPENYSVVTYALREIDGQTTVTVTQENCGSEEACAQAEKNWGMVLDGMKKLLES